MKILIQSSQFKKDLKRIQNNPKKLESLETALNLLRKNVNLPPKYKPHLLLGQYKGYMECHIESDFLLIWLDENKNTIKLVRLGSHSELFKK